MGNLCNRRKTAPLPVNHLRPLYLRLKSMKNRMGSFEPTVGSNWGALYKEAKAVYVECSKLLSSSTWKPVPKERKAIALMKEDTGKLVDMLKPFYKRRSGLTLQKMVQLNALIEAERRDIEPLIDAFEEELKSKSPGEKAVTNRWIALIRRFGSSVRRVGLFIGMNVGLEASLVTCILTGNVVGAVIDGVQLTTYVFSDVHSWMTHTEQETVAVNSEYDATQNVTTETVPSMLSSSTVPLVEAEARDTKPFSKVTSEEVPQNNLNVDTDQTSESIDKMVADSYILIQMETQHPEDMQLVDIPVEVIDVAIEATNMIYDEENATQNRVSAISNIQTVPIQTSQAETVEVPLSSVCREQNSIANDDQTPTPSHSSVCTAIAEPPESDSENSSQNETSKMYEPLELSSKAPIKICAEGSAESTALTPANQ